MNTTENKITDAKRISLTINKIVRSASPVTLKIGATEHILKSTIIDFNEKQQFLDIDSFADEALVGQLCSSNIHVECLLDGSVVRFVVNNGKAVNKAVRFGIPQEIERIQRRKAFRITLPQGSDEYFCIINLEKEHQCRIHNISAAGVAIISKQKLNVEIGKVVENCQLNLGQLKVVTSMQAKRETKIDAHSYLYGFEYENINDAILTTLENEILKLQREQVARARWL